MLLLYCHLWSKAHAAPIATAMLWSPASPLQHLLPSSPIPSQYILHMYVLLCNIWCYYCSFFHNFFFVALWLVVSLDFNFMSCYFGSNLHKEKAWQWSLCRFPRMWWCVPLYLHGKDNAYNRYQWGMKSRHSKKCKYLCLNDVSVLEVFRHFGNASTIAKVFSSCFGSR